MARPSNSRIRADPEQLSPLSPTVDTCARSSATTPPDGRVTGDPLPLALGVGVQPETVPVLECALAGHLLDGELVLAVVRVADTNWEMYYVLTSHHAARVALSRDDQTDNRDARIVTCAYEHMRSGLVDVRLDTGEQVDLGPLAHPRDIHLIHSGMSNLRMPEGFDGRHVFAESDAVRTAGVVLSELH
ncbi:hypothetical protein [Litorihabitans aurantiacus]|uniref:Uncharacterized protein n=1 Tax=Litorihabitans aurantiacus TaxID=1930061 RepID=A0AA37XH28_9MICO|nr:hypothetical protein [Litorihabitans aurantiacus]GMA33197.1 hypothetical protein GCM10025875_31890 [Litorihabitans aurantiacus]